MKTFALVPYILVSLLSVGASAADKAIASCEELLRPTLMETLARQPAFGAPESLSPVDFTLNERDVKTIRKVGSLRSPLHHFLFRHVQLDFVKSDLNAYEKNGLVGTHSRYIFRGVFRGAVVEVQLSEIRAGELDETRAMMVMKSSSGSNLNFMMGPAGVGEVRTLGRNNEVIQSGRVYQFSSDKFMRFHAPEESDPRRHDAHGSGSLSFNIFVSDAGEIHATLDGYLLKR